MYETTIKLKDNINHDDYRILKQDIEKAFSNRIGTIINSSNETNVFRFKGDENSFPILDIGLINLKRNTLFWKWVSEWNWIDDEDISENCNLVDVFTKPLK